MGCCWSQACQTTQTAPLVCDEVVTGATDMAVHCQQSGDQKIDQMVYCLSAVIANEHIELGWSMPPKPGHGIKTSWHVAVYAQMLLTHAMISHIQFGINVLLQVHDLWSCLPDLLE